MLAEPRAPVRRDFEGLRHRVGVVRIRVQHGRAHDARDVGRVGRGAAVARQRGEADLVVDHDCVRVRVVTVVCVYLCVCACVSE